MNKTLFYNWMHYAESLGYSPLSAYDAAAEQLDIWFVDSFAPFSNLCN